MIAGPPSIPGVQDLVELARGGSSTVYRGVQTSVGRVVAVKVLDAVALDRDGQELFANEVAALGALSGHPSVVGIYDAGVTESGAPYVVMEHLAAGSLADRLRTDGAVGAAEVPAIGAVIGRVLADAHDAGIVHGDVKPANLLLDQAGRVKLSDFGVATVGAKATARSYATASFAAPEVLAGEPAGPASDVYALGATLFALAVGVPPFAVGSDDEEHRRTVAVEPVPTDELVEAGASEATVAAVTSALAKAAEDRPSAAGLAQRLAGPDHDAVPAPSRSARRPGVVAGVAAGIVLLLGAGLLLFNRDPGDAPAEEVRTEAIAATTVPTTVPRTTTSAVRATTTVAAVAPIAVVPGDETRLLEVTADALWVEEGGELKRLDPLTFEAEVFPWTAETPVGTVVGTDAGPWVTTDGDVAPIDVEGGNVGEWIEVFEDSAVIVPSSNGDEVWMTTLLPTDARRLDVERQAVTGSVPVPANQIAAIPIAGDGAVYVTWQKIGSAITMTRFDSETLEPTATAELPMGQLGFRPFHDGAVWATDPLRGVVMKLDAETLEVVAEIPVGETPEVLAAGDEGLWVGVTGDRSVVRVDTDTLEVDAEIPVGDLPEFVEVGGGFVWVKTVLGPWTRYDATAF